MALDRRDFISGMAGILAFGMAPAFVRAGVLMRCSPKIVVVDHAAMLRARTVELKSDMEKMLIDDFYMIKPTWTLFLALKKKMLTETDWTQIEERLVYRVGDGGLYGPR